MPHDDHGAARARSAHPATDDSDPARAETTRSTIHRAARALIPAAVLAVSASTAAPVSAAPPPLEPSAPVGSQPTGLAQSIGVTGIDGALRAATESLGSADTAILTAGHAAAPPPAGIQRPAGLSADVTQGGIPDVNFAAYTHAAQVLADEMPACGIDWTLIAGIGRVESTHADEGATDDQGTLVDPIYGPVLDGSLGGNQVVTDTDGGRHDGDSTYDRAVGPTQFLPSTWERYAEDANGDGEADPQNLYDAALTTGRYLCDDGLDLRNPVDITSAVLRYNHSTTYVDKVLGYSHSYSSL